MDDEITSPIEWYLNPTTHPTVNDILSILHRLQAEAYEKIPRDAFKLSTTETILSQAAGLGNAGVCWLQGYLNHAGILGVEQGLASGDTRVLMLAVVQAAKLIDETHQLLRRLDRVNSHRSRQARKSVINDLALEHYDRTVGDTKGCRQRSAAVLVSREIDSRGWDKSDAPKPKTIGVWVREREKRWETFRSRALAAYDQTSGDTSSERAALVAQAIGEEPDAPNAETILRWVRRREKSRLPKSRISVV